MCSLEVDEMSCSHLLIQLLQPTYRSLRMCHLLRVLLTRCEFSTLARSKWCEFYTGTSANSTQEPVRIRRSSVRIRRGIAQ